MNLSTRLMGDATDFLIEALKDGEVTRGQIIGVLDEIEASLTADIYSAKPPLNPAKFFNMTRKASDQIGQAYYDISLHHSEELQGVAEISSQRLADNVKDAIKVNIVDAEIAPKILEQLVGHTMVEGRFASGRPFRK